MVACVHLQHWYTWTGHELRGYLFYFPSDAVTNCSFIRWKAVSDLVKTRSPDRKYSSSETKPALLTFTECAKRWRNTLDPKLVRSNFSNEEVRFSTICVDTT